VLLKNKYLEEQIAEYAVKHKENFYRLAYSYVKMQMMLWILFRNLYTRQFHLWIH